MINTNESIDSNKSLLGSSTTKIDFRSKAGPLPDNFVPTEKDIVGGRGNAYSNRPGNTIFTSIIKQHLPRYINTPKRNGRSLIVASILEEILEAGCRFVKKDRKTQQWYEMTREQAHDKTSHAIRDMIRYSDEETVGSKVQLRRASSRSSSVKSSRASITSKKTESKTLSNIEPLNDADSSSHDIPLDVIEVLLNETKDEENRNGCVENVSGGNKEDLSSLDLAPIDLNVSHEDTMSGSIDSRDFVKALEILSMDD
mmetsp:Transcript_15348/g.24875  ORF Transcript_15348/g.24875 Transcript_15348/m.24875 type:complete len:256 (-) Transcript_15348:82-849(-)